MLLAFRFQMHVFDVSNFEQVQKFAHDVTERHGRVTHLVNNAGVGLIGTFDQISIDDFEWLMGINFWGVVYGCKVFLPCSAKEDEGHIVNISSVLAYCARRANGLLRSKFAVRGFTESLRHELEGTNISVTCVHPGGVKTNIVRNSRVGEKTPGEWNSRVQSCSTR